MKITPNQITLTRIFLIPVIIFFYLAHSFIPGAKLIAAGIFVIACITDFLDGHLARKYNMVTDLGKFLDSIADKLLVVCGFILVVADGTILSPYGVIALSIVVAREFIVSALRQIGATKDVVIQADMWGKIKANFQFFSVLLFMIYSFFIDLGNLSKEANFVFILGCYLLLAVCVIATIVSGAHYLVAYKDVFHDAKNTPNRVMPKTVRAEGTAEQQEQPEQEEPKQAEAKQEAPTQKQQPKISKPKTTQTKPKK